MLNLGAEINRP